MNFILCDEDCRYQHDGVCELDDITTDCISDDKRCLFFAGR